MRPRHVRHTGRVISKIADKDIILGRPRERGMDDWVAKRGLSLIEAKRLRQLSERSDAQGLLQLGSQLIALAVTGAGIVRFWGSWWGVPFFLAHGILINCLYAGQHEMSHWTAFKSRWLNNV